MQVLSHPNYSTYKGDYKMSRQTKSTKESNKVEESVIALEAIKVNQDSLYDSLQAIFKDDVFGGSFASKVAYGQVSINAKGSYPTGEFSFSGIWVKDNYSPTLVNIALKNASDLEVFYRLHLYLSAKVLNTSQPDAVTAQLLCHMIKALEDSGVKRFTSLIVISADKRELKYNPDELTACQKLAFKHTEAKRDYLTERAQAAGSKERSKRSNKIMPVY